MSVRRRHSKIYLVDFTTNWFSIDFTPVTLPDISLARLLFCCESTVPVNVATPFVVLTLGVIHEDQISQFCCLLMYE
jgi:hypothetical protein